MAPSRRDPLTTWRACGRRHLHVAAACTGLGVGLLVLLRRKGGAWHVALGRLFLASMIVVNLLVLLRYEATGRSGPFDAPAVVSPATTTLGWLALRRRPRGRGAIAAHATLMTWSWLGVVTAGLAQFANQQCPEQSPWLVVTVVALATGIGLVSVPRYVSGQLSRGPQQRELAGPPVVGRRAGHGSSESGQPAATFRP